MQKHRRRPSFFHINADASRPSVEVGKVSFGVISKSGFVHWLAPRWRSVPMKIPAPCLIQSRPESVTQFRQLTARFYQIHRTTSRAHLEI